MDRCPQLLQRSSDDAMSMSDHLPYAYMHGTLSIVLQILRDAELAFGPASPNALHVPLL